MNVEKITLNNLRTEIDNIDATIISNLAKRNKLIKHINNLDISTEEIKSPVRFSSIISSAREQAISKYLSPNLVTEIFTLIIEGMIQNNVADKRNAKCY
jgi:isochorismate pyruvate lyase